MAGQDDAEGSDEESFPTVSARGRATLEVRGSEFVGHAAPARTVEEAEAFVEEVRAAHPDATHNVPSYRVREDDGLLRQHQSDEEEPTGSAGKPALSVLERRGLENVVVVVSRYFGGTELGVGGLARAYAEATKRAVDAAGVVEAVPLRRLTITVEYDDSGTVRGIVESEGVEFDADYGERVTFTARVRADEADRVRDRVLSATAGRAELDVERG